MSPRLLRYPGDLSRAAAIVKAGGVVAYPTETFYGLGADPFRSAGIDAVYAAKRRPSSLSLPLIVDHPSSVELVASEVPPMVRQWMEQGWPAGLTVVLPARDGLDPRVTREGTVALRVSPHPAARALARLCGGAITSTSANLSGEPPVRDPRALEHLGVDAILDGGLTPGGAPSTIIVPKGTNYEILRQGAWQGETYRAPEIPGGWTRDKVPDVEGWVFQPPKGYRFNVDSIVVARHAAALVPEGGRVLDLGAGTGVISVHLALSSPARRIDAIEMDREMVDAMVAALSMQRLMHRVDALHGRVEDSRNIVPGGSYDVVVTNPPYFRAGRGRAAGARERASHSDSLEPFVEAAARALAPSGRMVAIVPPERVQELLALAHERKLELERMVPYAPEGKGVLRLVLEMKKGTVQRPIIETARPFPL